MIYDICFTNSMTQVNNKNNVMRIDLVYD